MMKSFRTVAIVVFFAAPILVVVNANPSSEILVADLGVRSVKAASTVTNSKSTGAAYKSVLIRGVPHVRQKPDFCGEACAASWLKKLGRSADQDFVFDQSRLDPVLARGCFTKELATALRRIGFEIGPVWHKVAVSQHDEQIEKQWRTLHRDLSAGVPSIICMHYDDRPNTTEHFRLILGYDSKTDEVIYHEPAEDHGAYRRMKRTMLIKLWPLKYAAKEWQIVRMPLVHRRIARTEKSKTFTAADYAQHIMQLKKNPQQFILNHDSIPFRRDRRRVTGSRQTAVRGDSSLGGRAAERRFL